MHTIAAIGGIAALVLFCLTLVHLLRNDYTRWILLYVAMWPAHWLDARRARKWKAPEAATPVEWAHAAYEEPDHVQQKREAYVARRAAHSAHEREVLEFRAELAKRQAKAGMN